MSTPKPSAAVELKVIASTVVALLAGVAVTALNLTVGDTALMGSLPTWSQTVLTLAIPPVATFLAGYQARHTPRPELVGK